MAPTISPTGLLRKIQKFALAHDVMVLRHSESNYLDAHLRRVIEALDIEVVIDVGANVGQTVDELRSHGFAGQVVSFEPTPGLFDQLTRKLSSDRNWTGYQLALGSTAGTLTLNRYREETLNSFRSPTAFGASRFTTMAEAPIGTVEVEVARLDDIWDSTIPNGRTLLKIDTQGFDIEVLRGAAGHLDRTRAILTEVPVNRIYDGMPAMSDVFIFLAEQGYQLSGFFPLTRDRQRLRLIEANCMFLRNDLFD